MFPAAFDYIPARSTDEALSVLAQYGGDARVLAGGQSLIPAMRFRLAKPAVLDDIVALEPQCLCSLAEGGRAHVSE